jgi:hypothetical protein
MNKSKIITIEKYMLPIIKEAKKSTNEAAILFMIEEYLAEFYNKHPLTERQKNKLAILINKNWNKLDNSHKKYIRRKEKKIIFFRDIYPIEVRTRALKLYEEYNKGVVK